MQRSLSSALLVGLLLVGCKISPPMPPSAVTQITVLPSEVTLQGGESRSFEAVVTVTGNASKEVTWSSTGGNLSINGNVATLVAPAQEGDYSLTATSVADTSQTFQVPVHVRAAIETGSPAVITVQGVAADTFNPTNATITLNVKGAELSGEAGAAAIMLNGLSLTPSQFTVTPHSVQLSPIFSEGLNTLKLLAEDTQGLPVEFEYGFWAGNHSLTVNMTDATAQSIAGANVSVRLAESVEVAAQVTNQGGTVTFNNLPDRTIVVEGQAAPQLYGVTAVNGGAGTANLTLLDIKPASPVDNNDFILGLTGWEVGNAPVTLIPHVEDQALVAAHVLAPVSRQSWKQSGSSTAATLWPQADNMDLQLATQGEGPQTLTRTFQVKPGTKNVKVRYKFVTSEVPGGYFGTKYNDYYRVTLRSANLGAKITDGNSMNALGLGAFNSQGATAWRTVDLPVKAEQGETVQVEAVVANVADDLLDSYLVVDLVEENKLAITSLQLNDIDNAPLDYLSVGPHQYFGGNTRIHGTIALEGEPKDRLTKLTLEILQGGTKVAQGELAPTAAVKLLVPFDQTGQIRFNTSELLFNLSSVESDKVDVSSNGTLQLRIAAETSSGQAAKKDLNRVINKLVRYDASNRYGGRDENRGGDDWVLPSVKKLAASVNGVTWGDFSNMNAGSFSPDHQTHRSGVDVDGHFVGYNDRNADTAKKMIEYLNNPIYGSRITSVYVTFSKTGSNTAFWNAIKDATLNDGRAVADVIRPVAGHTTHFHWVFQSQ